MVFQLDGLPSSWNGYRVIDFPPRTILRDSSHAATFSKDDDAEILRGMKKIYSETPPKLLGDGAQNI